MCKMPPPQPLLALSRGTFSSHGPLQTLPAQRHGVRDLFRWQKRPVAQQKGPMYMAKETYYMAKETYYMAKEAYYMAKEAYYMAKQT